MGCVENFPATQSVQVVALRAKAPDHLPCKHCAQAPDRSNPTCGGMISLQPIPQSVQVVAISTASVENFPPAQGTHCVLDDAPVVLGSIRLPAPHSRQTVSMICPLLSEYFALPQRMQSLSVLSPCVELHLPEVHRDPHAGALSTCTAE